MTPSITAARQAHIAFTIHEYKHGSSMASYGEEAARALGVSEELSGAFGIRSIPSLLFVPKEGKPKMAMGAILKEQLKSLINKEFLGVS